MFCLSLYITSIYNGRSCSKSDASSFLRHKTTNNSSNSNSSNRSISSNPSNSNNCWSLWSTSLQIMSPLCRHKWFKVRMEVWLSRSIKKNFRSSGDRRTRTPSRPMNLSKGLTRWCLPTTGQTKSRLTTSDWLSVDQPIHGWFPRLPSRKLLVIRNAGLS